MYWGSNGSNKIVWVMPHLLSTPVVSLDATCRRCRMTALNSRGGCKKLDVAEGIHTAAVVRCRQHPDCVVLNGQLDTDNPLGQKWDVVPRIGVR
jgi:hypothetical protein